MLLCYDFLEIYYFPFQQHKFLQMCLQFRNEQRNISNNSATGQSNIIQAKSSQDRQLYKS